MLAEAATFLGIVTVLAVTPGADMALVMRHVLAHGFRAAWPTLGGIFSGLAVHAVLCVAGLSVVLRQSDVAFASVKLLGAGWLVWMGVGAVREAIRARRSANGATSLEPALMTLAPMPPARTLYVRGFFTNLLNVKIALFYIAFLPQFAPAGDRFVPVAIGLAFVQGLVGFLWLLTYGALVARAGHALGTSPRAKSWLEAVTGVALIGFGVRLAAASR